MAASTRATGIETRTLLLFVACALLPVVAFAVLSYLVISEQLQASAERQLGAAAKSYGLAILDRLQLVDQRETQLADRVLDGSMQSTSINVFSDHRATVRLVEAKLTNGTAHGATDEPPAATKITRRLGSSISGQNTYVTLDVIAEDARGRVHVSAQLNPDYLWNADANLLQEAIVCVHGTAIAINHCTGSNDAGIHNETLSAQWDLFLGAVYAAPSWTIEMRQPAQAAYGALRAFRWILPLSAAVAVASALLLGSIFIRRSHAPLRQLTEAARRIGRKNFGRPIAVRSRDEYGRLARAFNRMAAGLRQQFSLLSILTRADQMILARRDLPSVAAKLLRRMPGLLSSRVVAVVLRDSAEGASVYFALHGSQEVHHRQSSSRGLDALQFLGSGLHRRSNTDAGMRELFAAIDDQVQSLWLAPIVIGGQFRGCAMASDEGSNRNAVRHLRGIAHRLAVAIGNEDRDRQLWNQAHYDSLTGLANRVLLNSKLNETVAVDSRRPCALIFIDLDRFKAVNDSLGHAIGDQLLQHVASRLLTVAPTGATVARLGGDEFTVLIPGADRVGAQECAQRLLAALDDPWQLQELRYVAQASMGIALAPEHGDTAATLLKNADIAMYRAKAGGPGRVCFFDATMGGDASERFRLEDLLRRSIKDDEIRLHYQPKMDADGRPVAVEALARWQTSSGEHVSPGVFIPLAEETGLIVPMGAALLRQACRQMRQWRERNVAVEHMAINISMLQMRDPGFPLFVRQCLAENDLPGGALQLELTESLLAGDPAGVTQQLRELRSIGVSIAIDDFGTGFSSMSLLRDYPISALKIDRSFVIDCAVSERSRMLIKALIDVGHALKLEVVAEGIEEQAQLAVLRDLGCDVMQGYLFSAALTPEAIGVFFSNHRATDLRDAV